MVASNLQDTLQQIDYLVSSGKLQQALTICLSGLEKLPEEKKLLLKLANIREIEGDFNNAKSILEKVITKHSKDLSLLHQFLLLSLRNNKFAVAEEIIEKIECFPPKSKWAIDTKQKAQILFDFCVQNYLQVEKLAKEYIAQHPDRFFGYSFYMQSVLKIRPANLTQILNSVQSTIEARNLPLFLKKEALRRQQKYYSLLAVNKTELDNTQDANQEKQLLIEKLSLLLNFDADSSEIDTTIDELFSEPIAKPHLATLLGYCCRYEPLESRLLEYIHRNPQWLDYHRFPAIAPQVKIIKQCRQQFQYRSTTQLQSFPVLIDVVYTWCDLEDPIFSKKLRIQSGFDPEETSNPSQAKYRYTNNNEIKLSLLSLFKYFPKVNQVYIVTNDQQFELDFLTKAQQNKIQFIDHSEIIPSEYVSGDVFNSNLIETFLWRIPNLQEHYLYFNDDVILGNYLQPHHLFSHKGQALALLRPRVANKYQGELKQIAEYSNKKRVPPVISRENAFRDYQIKNNMEANLTDFHQGVFLLKSVCKEAFFKYCNLWQKNFFKENIRGEHSVFTALTYQLEAIFYNKQSLGNYYEYCRRSIFLSDYLNLEKVRYVREVKPLFYCIGIIPDGRSKELLQELIDYISTK